MKTCSLSSINYLVVWMGEMLCRSWRIETKITPVPKILCPKCTAFTFFCARFFYFLCCTFSLLYFEDRQEWPLLANYPLSMDDATPEEKLFEEIHFNYKCA